MVVSDEASSKLQVFRTKLRSLLANHTARRNDPIASQYYRRSTTPNILYLEPPLGR